MNDFMIGAHEYNGVLRKPKYNGFGSADISELLRFNEV